MSDLQIPDKALDCLRAIDSTWTEDVDARLVVQTIAAPVVAAELRRLAGLVETYGGLSAKVDVHATHMLDAEALRNRADELDGGCPDCSRDRALGPYEQCATHQLDGGAR